MKASLKSFLEQAVRQGVAFVLSAIVSKYQNDPRYLALAPLLHALAEALRTKYPGLEKWLPL